MSRRRNACAALAAGLALAGCAGGPAYRRPALDVPAAFRAQEGAPGQRSLADLDWPELYRDPDLRRLLQAALEQNRDVQLAAARIAEARAQLGASRLGQLPQLDAALGSERGRVFQSGGYVTGALHNAGVTASYEADVWGRLASLSEAARAALLSSESAREAVRIGLIGDVAGGYFSLLALDQQLAITQSTVASRERFLQLTRRKFNHGAASALDVSRADASWAAARAAVPDLQRQIAQAENAMQILLGRNPAPVPRAPHDLSMLPLPPEIPAGLPSSLLERRPDLLQAESDLMAATADVRAAKGALFPKITLTGSLGWESVELSKLFSGPTRLWSFGLNFLQPLLDAQRNGYLVDAAEARRLQAALRYQGAVAQAFREVSDALAATRGYSEFLDAQRHQVEALREASRRVLRRYEVGYSSYFEVIDADSALFAAELQLTQAYRNKLLSVVQLYKALGGGWRPAARQGEGDPAGTGSPPRKSIPRRS